MLIDVPSAPKEADEKELPRGVGVQGTRDQEVGQRNTILIKSVENQVASMVKHSTVAFAHFGGSEEKAGDFTLDPRYTYMMTAKIT